MENKIIKYTCSLGTNCHSSYCLKLAKIKKCSYPFDWGNTNPRVITHCIEDDFNIFFDQSYWKGAGQGQIGCNHTYYFGGEYITAGGMFAHRDPHKKDEDYNYYVRCVERFRKLLKCEGHKLFVIFYSNMDSVTDECNEVIRLNDKLSNFTQNYTILSVFHFPGNQENSFEIIKKDNIDFLMLRTMSRSYGEAFENPSDNAYLSSILHQRYTFDVLENPHR